VRLSAALADLRGLPHWRLEDGFVRSVGLGVSGEPPLSILVDDVGIYYDARRPSRLERLIEEGGGDLDRARRAIDRIVAAQISKYNHAPPGWSTSAHRARASSWSSRPGEDPSVEGALAAPGSFQAMLEAASPASWSPLGSEKPVQGRQHRVPRRAAGGGGQGQMELRVEEQAHGTMRGAPG
jgi:capsule polysaccharide export protein KpsC/LpsZ